MQTHALQFGRHKAHSHAMPVGGSFSVSRPKSSGNPQHDALVKQTQKWVAQTFYGELLKQMRNSPFKSKMFDGGEGGQAFTQMFDQQLADKMSTGSGRKLVDSIVNKIEAGKAYGKVAVTPPAHKRIAPVQMSPTLKTLIGGVR